MVNCADGCGVKDDVLLKDKARLTTNKWDIYFMRIAEAAASISNCSSRGIGAALANDEHDLVSTGMNGSPRGITHCRDRFLNGVEPAPDALLAFWEKVASEADNYYLLEITKDNVDSLIGERAGVTISGGVEYVVRNTYHPCPRKWLGYPSGEGLSLCNAGHAERNAIIQAARIGVSTRGCTLFCYCGQVCKDCLIEIINAGITRLVFLAGSPSYDVYSTILLEESGMDWALVDKRDLDL